MIKTKIISSKGGVKNRDGWGCRAVVQKEGLVEIDAARRNVTSAPLFLITTYNPQGGVMDVIQCDTFNATLDDIGADPSWQLTMTPIDGGFEITHPVDMPQMPQ